MRSRWNFVRSHVVDVSRVLASLIVLGSTLAISAEPLCSVGTPATACTTRADTHTAIGSTSVLDPLGRGIWVIDEENDAVALMLPTGTSRRYQVGRWPQQIVAASSGRIFVSSRQDGRIDIIDPDHRQQHLAVGDEPRALALDDARNRLYVGLVSGRAIVAVDAKSLQPVARTEVADAPVTLALTSAGLAVASDRSRTIRFYDLKLRDETRQVHLPAQRAAHVSPRLFVPTGDGVLLIAERARTGLDQPVSFGGYGGGEQSQPMDTLLFSLNHLERGYAPAIVLGAIHASEPVAALYKDEVLYIASRGRGTVVALGLTSETGALSTPIELRPALWKFVKDAVREDEALNRYTNSNAEPMALQADLTGVLADAQGRLIATDALGRRLLHLQTPEGMLPVLARRVGGLQGQPILQIRGQTSAFMGDVLEPQGFGGLGLRGGGFLSSAGPFAREAFDTAVVPVLVQSLGPGRDAELRVGQALFHNANDFRISAHGVACASCHPDGREDGRVWSLTGTRRQTPMLAMRVKDTAPFNWLGTAKTLEANIVETMTERLEGEGLQTRELKALTRFVGEGLRPVSQPAPKEPELVAQGRELFNDSVVGCGACHPADFATTDGQRHDVGSLSAVERREFRSAHPPRLKPFSRKTMQAFGPIERALKLAPSRGVMVPGDAVPKRFDTPSLRAVALTAPYFHDGAADSLEALIANNADRMGTTSHLDETQRRALVAYLQTL